MAFSIRNLKIRQQILLVTFPPLCVLLCAIALLFYSYWMALHANRGTRQSLESIAQSEELLRHVSEMYMGVRGFIFTQQAASLTLYEQAASTIPGDIANLRELESGSAAQTAEVNALSDALSRFQADFANRTISRINRGVTIDAPLTLSEGDRRMAALRQMIEKLLQEDHAENLKAMIEEEQQMRRMVMVALGVAILVGVIVLLVTREVTGLLVQPVRQMIEASERVSRGDFRVALPPAADNEFGILSQSFSHMTSALRQEREEMASLNRFSEAVTQCTSEGEIYDHVLFSIRERFHPHQVIIFKLNPEENLLEAVATLVPLPDELRDWPVIAEPHNCKAVRTGRHFRVNDVSVEPPCPSKFVIPGEGSYYCGPLIAGGVIIGAVRVEGIKDYWSTERESLLESYLSGAASALSNLRLLETTKQQANVDELTGIYNRRFLEEYARKLLAMARRKGQPLGVIMMDLDHFKEFNDVYGHEVGDRILRHFAKTATQAMREANLAARYGGEEFVVVLPETDAQGCMRLAERIRMAVERMVVPSGTEKPLPQLTVSLGIAVYPEHGHSLEELLQASDKALYESKRAGRNRATIYVPQEEPAS
ncbi:MAG: diguanylate cyclase [Terriglobia bacterium]